MDTPPPFTPEQLAWVQGRLPREVADAPLLGEPHSGSGPPGLPGPSGASPPTTPTAVVSAPLPATSGIYVEKYIMFGNN